MNVGKVHGSEPVTRTVDLTRRFDAGETVTARQVSWRYEVSLRTAQRWLAELEPLIPLEYETCSERRIWRKR